MQKNLLPENRRAGFSLLSVFALDEILDTG